jgi:hypothetical protein
MVRLFFTPSAVIKNTNIGPPMKIQNHDKSKSLTSYPWQLEQFCIRFIDLIFETWPRSVPSKKKAETM